MRMIMGRRAFAVLAVLAGLVLTQASACESDADTVSRNISTEADQFKVSRKIVVTNMVDNTVVWEATGKCSIDIGRPDVLVLTCKEPGGEFKKHYLGVGGMYVQWASTQLDTSDVSVDRTKIVFRPLSVVPDVDITVGGAR